tara:strand:- start:394 stop:1452 length:1059 start_codon:yes stop_codon:yes gene_type:complete
MKNITEIINKLLNKYNLTFEESYQLMNQIMSGKISEIKLSSILTSLSLKGESEDEIAGMAKSMQENALRLETKHDCLDIVGTGGDNLSTFNVSTTSALVAASSGVKVAKHGNRAASGNSGSADVLEALNINIDIDIHKSIEMLDKYNFTFMFAQKFHPSMRYAMPTRKELGFKTIFNNLGPLTNPANSKYLMIGVSDIETGNKISNALRILNKTALVVHGMEGLDEASIFDDTYVWEIRPNLSIEESPDSLTNLAASTASLREYKINPDQFGLKKISIEKLKVNSPKESASKILQLFKEDNNELIDCVALNTGLGLYISGYSNDIKSGIEIAKSNIKNGNAAKLINDLSLNY